MLSLILLVAALVVFVIAAVRITSPRLDLIAVGLALVAGAQLAARFGG